MKRPSNKEIKAAVEKLKAKPGGESKAPDLKVGKESAAKTSRRIRKQGV